MSVSSVFNGQGAGPAIATEQIPSHIYPRDPAGAIHIGERHGKAWEPVMLYRTAHDELVTLFAMLDKLAAWLGNSSRLDGPAWVSEAEGLGRELMAMKARLQEVRGGEPSAGFKGRAAGHTGG